MRSHFFERYEEKSIFFPFNFLSYYSYFYAEAFWDAQNQNTQQINVLASGFVLNV
jgi:hypothetical protein